MTRALDVFAFGRATANELVLAAALAPLMVSNLRAPVSRKVVASDASLAKGALVPTSVPKAVAELVWRAADSNGGYTRLDLLFRAARKALGDPMLEEEPTDAVRRGPGLVPVPCSKPSLRFDFIEVCGGGEITRMSVGLSAVLSWTFPSALCMTLRAFMFLTGSSTCSQLAFCFRFLCHRLVQLSLLLLIRLCGLMTTPVVLTFLTLALLFAARRFRRPALLGQPSKMA